MVWRNVTPTTSSQMNYEKVSVVRSLTPNYQQLILNEDWVPPRPYRLEIIRAPAVEFGYLYDQWDNPWPYDWSQPRLIQRDAKFVWGTFNNILDGGIAITSAAETELEAQFSKQQSVMYNKSLKKLQHSSLAVIMAYKERHQTGNMVLKRLDDMIAAARHIRHPVKFFKSLHKRNPTRKERRTLRNCFRRVQLKHLTHPTAKVGDMFLEYRFGWIPLILDVNEALESTVKQAEKQKRTFVKAGYKCSARYSASGRPFLQGPPFCDVVAERTGGGHIKIYYTVNHAILSALGMIQNPWAVAWDAVGYSFLVDYLADISTYLDLTDATMGLSFQGGYESRLYEQSIHIDGRVNKGDTAYRRRVRGYGNWAQEKFLFTRTVLNDFPTPQLITSPLLDAILGNDTIVASLLVQKIDKFRRILDRKY